MATNYISSDGTEKDVTSLDTQYLINALAKAYREMFLTNDEYMYYKHSDNIIVLTRELQSRQNTYFNSNIGGKI